MTLHTPHADEKPHQPAVEKGLKWRITATLAAALVYAVLVALVFIWVRERMKSEFVSSIQSKVGSLDLQIIRGLQGTAKDKSAPGFQKLLRQFQHLVMANPDFQYAYLLRKVDDRVVFLLDAQNEIYEETAALEPGTPFEDSTPELLFALENPDAEPFVEGPVSDEWGTWYSALVPLLDPSTGNVTAVFGVDIDHARWNRELALRLVPPVSILTALLILAIALLILRSPHITQERPRTVTGRLMAPILLSQLLLFAGFILFAVQWQKRHIEMAQRNAVDRVAGNLEVLLKERENLLRASVRALQIAPQIGRLLATENKNLIQLSLLPLFEQARQEIGVDLLYFIDPDGKVLARLHEPGLSGDQVTDSVFLRAQETGSIEAGIGVGYLGRAALRAAGPVFLENKLVGYVELGTRIATIAKSLRVSEPIGLAITLDKAGLDERFFNPGPMEEGANSWERFPEDVLIYSSTPALPPDLERHLSGQIGLEQLKEENQKAQSVLARFPLHSFVSDQIGTVYVYFDTHSMRADFHRFLASVFSISGVLFAFVISLLGVILRRTDDAIRAQNEELLELNRQLELEKAHAEAATLRAEAANRAKSDFLAVMSHEIRNPVGVLVGINDLLAETGLTSEQQELVDLARGSATNLVTLINNTLDLSKIEAGAMVLESAPMDIREILHATAAANRPEALRTGLSLKVVPAEDLPEEVLGDPTRLRQILQNLLGNALKFTSTGAITLSASTMPRAGQAEDRIAVRFEVADTGIGIPPEKVSSIFEKYRQADHSTTRRYGGTGLGLSICKELVEKMGGEIGVESKPGTGTKFWFEIAFPKPPAKSTGNPCTAH